MHAFLADVKEGMEKLSCTPQGEHIRTGDIRRSRTKSARLKLSAATKS